MGAARTLSSRVTGGFNYAKQTTRFHLGGNRHRAGHHRAAARRYLEGSRIDYRGARAESRRQSAGVQAAYYGFIDRFRAVPGDMLASQVCGAIGNNPAWSCPTGVGGTAAPPGGDGQINAGVWSEAAAAWSHMTAAGFLQGNYPGTAGAETAYVSTATPAAPRNPWNGFLLLGRTNDYRPGTTSQAPRLHLISGRNVPVNVMREMDVKVDDSSPDSGILRSAPLTATSPSFGNVGGSDATTACVTVGTPSIWNINGASADCNGYFLY